MIRPRELKTRDILSALPKEQRAAFLALDPAERRLLLAGTDEEKEHYAGLNPEAAKRFARLPESERLEEARQASRARRLEPRAPAAAASRPAEPTSPELADSSARVAESVADLFELAPERLERVQSMALNWMKSGATEDEALDCLSAVLLDEEVQLPACEPPPSRMQRLFGAGCVLRG